MINQDNQIITDNEEMKNIWKKYIKELFHDERPTTDTKINVKLSSPPITIEEIRKAMHHSKITKHLAHMKYHHKY